MNYYAPTTDEIREQIIWQFEGVAEKRAGDAFDHWLAEHDREVAATALEKFADQINRVTLRGPDNHMKHPSSVRRAASRLAVSDAATYREASS